MREGPPIGRTFLGGLLGTLVMTALLYWGMAYLVGRPSDVAGALAGLLEVSWATGMLVHFVNGSVLFPAVFALGVHPRLGGPPWTRGVAFGVLLWLGAEIVFSPLVGGGFFHASAGGIVPLTVSFVGHLLYGLVLGAVAGGSEVYGPQAEAEARAARSEEETAQQVHEPSRSHARSDARPHAPRGL